MEENKIVIYQTEDGQTQIDVRLENETVWLTQAQMAELFQTDRISIVRHINNIYKVEELDRESTCAKIAQVHQLSRPTIARTIKTLQSRKFIRRISSSKTVHWEVVRKEEGV